MKLLLFRHMWGIDEAPEDVFPKIKELEYNGIEMALPVKNESDNIKDLLDKYNFLFYSTDFY